MVAYGITVQVFDTLLLPGPIQKASTLVQTIL